jgi:glycosyl transferase family 1
MKPRLIYVVNHVPIPWVTGIMFQDWNVLNLLVESYAVTLVALDNGDLRSPAAVAALDTLRELCDEVVVFDRAPTTRWASARRRAGGVLHGLPSTMAHNVREDCRDAVREFVAKYPDSSVYAADFYVASAVTRLGHRGRTVVRLHNVESLFMRESLVVEPSLARKPLLLLDLLLTRMAERRIFRGLKPRDTILTCTAQDKLTIERAYKPTARVEFMPLCAPYGFAQTERNAGSAAEPTAVFTGTLDNPLNVSAIEWFVRKAWPLTRAKVPDARLLIAGRNPNSAALALGNAPSVTVIANPRDMGEVLKLAAVCIAPIFHGAGVKQKCLEAFYWGIPLVTTARGADGLGARPGEDYILADAADEFAAGVVAVFQDRGLRERLALNGRRYLADAHGDAGRREVLARALGSGDEVLA